jgi:uncharacterized protein YndB with AHSA1/START domain
MATGSLPDVRRVKYQIEVAVPRERVWDVMLSDTTYRDWTSVFSPGSHYVGGWETGDEIRFLGEGGQEGMASRIAESLRPETVRIEHVGVVKDGVVDTTSEQARKWAPSIEEYTFHATPEGTRLEVVMDVDEGYVDFFNDRWPKALARLKEIAEG